MSELLVNGRTHDGPCPELVWVPNQVAVCPECRGRLLVQCDGWEDATGKPIETCISVDCENEPDPDDPDWEDKRHRGYQSDWQPVIDRVRAWALRRVRVVRKGK